MHSFCTNVISLDRFWISFKIEKCSKGENELLTVFIEEAAAAKKIRTHTQCSGGPTEVRTSSFTHIFCRVPSPAFPCPCCHSVEPIFFLSPVLLEHIHFAFCERWFIHWNKIEICTTPLWHIFCLISSFRWCWFWCRRSCFIHSFDALGIFNNIFIIKIVLFHSFILSI